MKATVSIILIALIVVTFSPSCAAQDAKEKSQAYLEAWETQDLAVRVEKLTQAINEVPKMLAAHYYLGLTLSQLKRYDEAKAAYLRLAQIPFSPSEASSRFHFAGHYELGKLFLHFSDYEAAAMQYRLIKGDGRPNDLTDELALFLSDLFPKNAAEQYQIPISPMFEASDKPLEVLPMSAATSRIVITYKEKARYTEIARINKVQGTVVLRAVFTEDGKVTNIEVVRGQPDGLTRRAIQAAQLMRFEPATKEGKPLTVSGQLEFTFNLY